MGFVYNLAGTLCRGAMNMHMENFSELIQSLPGTKFASSELLGKGRKATGVPKKW